MPAKPEDTLTRVFTLQPNLKKYAGSLSRPLPDEFVRIVENYVGPYALLDKSFSEEDALFLKRRSTRDDVLQAICDSLE